MSKWKVAAYLRLSSDDGDKLESNSITNQKKLINIYINREKNLKVVDYYIDDGYSGTDFERPDFKRMIRDIKRGKIDTIIVKDLSRFGRNYIEVGRYLEDFLPINNNVDSYKDPESINNIIVPFKNLMNDEYSRDISNKVKSILNAKKESGEFIGSYAPYGYLRDPKNKHDFIIDEKASKVVIKIFDMILKGKSKKYVVDELNRLGILPPMAYKIEEFNYNMKKTNSYDIWNGKKIDDILRNISYTGVLVQSKKKRISHRVHKQVRVAPDDWIMIPNHHKALITEEKFNMVQEILYKRDIKVEKNKNYDLFAGHISCADCGNSLSKRKGKAKDYYYCTSYLENKVCSKHTIRKDKLIDIVIEAINNQIDIAENIDRTIKMMAEESGINYDYEILNNRLNDIKNNILKYTKLKGIVREDYATNIIKEDEYKDYIKDYNERLEQLEDEKEELIRKLNSEEIKSSKELKVKSNEEWIRKFEKKKHIDKLNNIIINELIEDIQVHDNGNINIIFKYQDEFIEAIDFIKREKYDIMLKNVV